MPSWLGGVAGLAGGLAGCLAGWLASFLAVWRVSRLSGNDFDLNTTPESSRISKRTLFATGEIPCSQKIIKPSSPQKHGVENGSEPISPQTHGVENGSEPTRRQKTVYVLNLRPQRFGTQRRCPKSSTGKIWETTRCTDEWLGRTKVS